MKNAFIILGLACLFSAMSCSGSQPALSSDQDKQASQMDEIGKKSGGDWNKLTPEEQKTMIQIGGSEQGAKMLLLAKSGKLGRHGGPPGGGPPAGASTGQ
jgi:hypothetical protein